MANASSAIPTCARVRWFGFAMNATMVRFKDGVSYAEVLGSQMLTTAKSVHSRRKIEMVVPRLSISGVRRLICSMNVKNMDSRNDDKCLCTRLCLGMNSKKQMFVSCYSCVLFSWTCYLCSGWIMSRM